MASNSLQLVGLRKSYPGFTLGPIDVEFASGRTYCFLGPNGAGKSTLFGSIAAQLHHEGEARWKGELIGPRNYQLREIVAYVPETPHLYDELTVAQTLNFCRGIFRRWNEALAKEWQMKLKLARDQRVGTLSKGMRVKLALLVGISHQAELLLLDEPTAGLDPESRCELQMHLRSLAIDFNVCTLISSHLFEDIESVAEDVVFLRNGQICFSASLQQIAQTRVYGVDPIYEAEFKKEQCVPIQKRLESKLEVIVVQPALLPEPMKKLLSEVESRPSSLREIYFALNGSNS